MHDNLSTAATDILTLLVLFGWPLLYIGFRVVVARSETSRAQGALVLGALSVLDGFFFLNLAAKSIIRVGTLKPAWGTLAGLLAIGLIALVTLLTLIHREDERYVDLLSGADLNVSDRRSSRLKKLRRLLKQGSAIWTLFFGVAVLWLWQMRRSG